MQREHFNGWYSATAYYIALTVTDIPLTILCASKLVFDFYYAEIRHIFFQQCSLQFCIHYQASQLMKFVS